MGGANGNGGRVSEREGDLTNAFGLVWCRAGEAMNGYCVMVFYA